MTYGLKEFDEEVDIEELTKGLEKVEIPVDNFCIIKDDFIFVKKWGEVKVIIPRLQTSFRAPIGIEFKARISRVNLCPEVSVFGGKKITCDLSAYFACPLSVKQVDLSFYSHENLPFFFP